MRRHYQRPEINIKVVRAAAKLLLDAGGNSDVNRGVRCMRDLCINTIQARRARLKRIRKAA